MRKIFLLTFLFPLHILCQSDYDNNDYEYFDMLELHLDYFNKVCVYYYDDTKNMFEDGNMLFEGGDFDKSSPDAKKARFYSCLCFSGEIFKSPVMNLHYRVFGNNGDYELMKISFEPYEGEAPPSYFAFDKSTRRDFRNMQESYEYNTN